MNFSFTKALNAITQASNSALESVRERILPTPGKRRREEKGIFAFESDRVKRRIAEPEEGRQGSLHPESQFAEAATPLADFSEVSKAPQSLPQWSTLPETSQAPPVGNLSGLSAHQTDQAMNHTLGAEVQFLRDDGQNNAACPGDNLFAGKGPPISKTRAELLAPWQRRYPQKLQPKETSHKALDIPSTLQFTPLQCQKRRMGFKTGAHAKQPQRGRSYVQTARASRRDLREREILQHMTRKWQTWEPPHQLDRDRDRASEVVIDLEQRSSPAAERAQSEQSTGARLTLPDEARDLQVDAGPSRWLQRPNDHPDGLELSSSVAQYQLERSQHQELLEERRERRERALADCADLIGDKQKRLLARASLVLGEKSRLPSGKGPSHNAAAEISKVSMAVASNKALALKASLTEMEVLEEQQRRLREQRDAQRRAQVLAQSALKPDRKTNGGIPSKVQRPSLSIEERIKQPIQQADIIDLLSSDEEGEDEAATLHGEISPRDASQEEEVSYSDETEEEDEEEEEEEETISRLSEVSVRDKVPPGYPPLTKHQLLRHRDALNHRANQSVELKLHKSSNIGVTRGLLACLKSRIWLNDEVMNLTMGLLQDRDKLWRPLERFPKCHFFSTFFFNKLFMDQRRYDYSAVARWTRPKKLQICNQSSCSVLDCDRLIAPVHLGVHWTCAMADLSNKEFIYYDSMGGSSKHIMQSLQRYIADEYKDKRQQVVDTTKWKIRYNPGKVPAQTNGCDCGVFALMIAEHLSREAPLTFHQGHMEYFRKLIAASIMDLKMFDNFGTQELSNGIGSHASD